MRELTFAQAINERIREEIRHDPSIVLIGGACRSIYCDYQPAAFLEQLKVILEHV